MTQPFANLSEDTLVEVLLPETVVPVMISSGYYANFKKIIEYHCRDKEESELTRVIDKFARQEEPSDEWEAHLYTMLQLSSDFENQARKAGFFKEVTLKEYLTLIGDSVQDN